MSAILSNAVGEQRTPDAMPSELWIELTSKCPFSCVFCSRELLRGKGEHMDFALYQRLIADLDAPRVIRLNYSGESGHYPQLIDAIRLAKAKGAYVELVSALSSMKRPRVEALVASGLDRLSVSVHSVEDAQYESIYGFGSASGLRERLGWIRDTQRQLGLQTPELDFAFVGMARNLGQLEGVMALAQTFAITQLDIHPVIRRDPIPETFPEELDDKNRLKKTFLDRLSNEVERLKTEFPGLQVNYSTPEPKPQHTLDHCARPYPLPLPQGARIETCDQNPWSTVHVLANGDVVTCEVRDGQPLGNLGQQSLKNIWRSAVYAQFRRDFVCGDDPKCARCVYKRAYLPRPFIQRLLPSWRPTRQHAANLGRWAKQTVAMSAALSLRTGLDALEWAARCLRFLHPAPKPAPLPASEDGVSVIIPERDAPMMLAECLQSLSESLARLDAPGQVIIVCNGTPSERYADLQARFADYQWCFEPQPLGFSGAVNVAMQHARWNWVFLLNSDMRLESDALAMLWSRRRPGLFSLAAQVHFQDRERRREETGLTALDVRKGLDGLYDREPFTSKVPVTHLYSGGGASLYQRRVLKRLLDSGPAYAPFYWEDVDWGMRAQLLGYQNLFVPDALAHHRHRATVSRFYSPETIDRMLERNALVNGLAHGWYRPPLVQLSMQMAKHRAALFTPARLAYLLRQRLVNGLSQFPRYNFHSDVIRLYPGQRQPHLPWLLIVSPYALFPIHGSARRIHSLARHLSQRFRIAIIADEGWRFDAVDLDEMDYVEALWLVCSPRKECGDNRLLRMKSHARAALRSTVREATQCFRPQVVQIEHEELAPLIDLKSAERWFLTLHDVNSGMDPAADRTLKRLVSRFDGVIACSREDTELLESRATLIENGVDLGRLHPGVRSSGKTLLFIGPFSYHPNRTGLDHFIRHCLPDILAAEPETRLQVLAGDEGLEAAAMAPFDHPSVEFLPYTSDIRPALQAATMTINPLRSIRGSCIKTIEALAAGRLCISTEDASRGWSAYQFPGLITVSGDQEFAEKVVHYLRNPQLRHAHELQPDDLLQRFDWSSRATEQALLYAS